MTKSVPSGSDKHTDNLAVKSFEDNPSVQQVCLGTDMNHSVSDVLLPNLTS